MGVCSVVQKTPRSSIRSPPATNRPQSDIKEDFILCLPIHSEEDHMKPKEL